MVWKPKFFTMIIMGVILSTIVSTTIISTQAFASPNVFSPGSSPYGQTYGEWSADWWRWAAAAGFDPIIYDDTNLPTDPDTGDLLVSDFDTICNEGQTDENVFYLAGTFGGSAERTCTVPEGKAIFFPLINALCTLTAANLTPLTKPADVVTTVGSEKICAKIIDRTNHLEVQVDGSEVVNLDQFRFKSGSFDITLPGLGPVNAVSDGYWIMLEPLSSGEHTIHFIGERTGGSPAGVRINGSFTTEVTYNLTVE
jgi:hypothetical protein